MLRLTEWFRSMKLEISKVIITSRRKFYSNFKIQRRWIQFQRSQLNMPELLIEIRFKWSKELTRILQKMHLLKMFCKEIWPDPLRLEICQPTLMSGIKDSQRFRSRNKLMLLSHIFVHGKNLQLTHLPCMRSLQVKVGLFLIQQRKFWILNISIMTFLESLAA